jgi:inorganic pyrophosphatase
MMTAMHYPANYGYVPQTIGDDDDPVDVLVHTPFPLMPDLEAGKWVKVIGWAGLDVAHAELLDGVRRYSAQDR